ncbi:MAG: pyridoxamine 5'-phosphate oxidase family protein [Rhizobiales bacterium]|nr:pyridoxamine 5'-phosphate oxidase family protein [Hyphomicrobiales bacterium]
MSASVQWNVLAASLDAAWAVVAAGVLDFGAPWHLPTIATVDRQGAARLRTVVLRDCDPARRQLRFHTDSRSSKASELAADPRIAVHANDAGRKLQIQLAGRALMASADGAGQAAWGSARLGSRACYAVEPGPGATIAEGGAYRLPADEAGILAGSAHFLAIEVTVERLEWLQLHEAGHRRAAFDWTGTAWDGRWLVP